MTQPPLLARLGKPLPLQLESPGLLHEREHGYTRGPLAFLDSFIVC
jgi:hypothetical protein